MKILTRKKSALTVFAIAAFSGCLPVDTETLPIDESCAIPPVSEREACESSGLIFVPEGEELELVHELREVIYQVGGDCGEATAIARCTVPIDICLEAGAIEDPCGAVGLEAIDVTACDVIEEHPTPPSDPEEIRDDDEQGTSNQIEEEREEGCIEPEMEEGNHEREEGCDLPEQAPTICRTIEISAGCGRTRNITCGLPEFDPRCPEIYAPVCGSDGVTYDNQCKAGITPIEYEGECEQIIFHEGSCFDAGLIAQNSTFEISAQQLPPQAGAWMDEEGNIHTVEQELTTEIIVNYDIFSAQIDEPYGANRQQPSGVDFVVESLEIRNQPFADGEVESMVLQRERWNDRQENGAVSDSHHILAPGHLEGEFTAKLSLIVHGEPCFVEASTVIDLDDDLWPTPPVPEPAPEPEEEEEEEEEG